MLGSFKTQQGIEMSEKFIRWKNDEWLRVGVNMAHRLDKGDANLQALATAMRKALPKERQQHDEYLHKLMQPKWFAKVLAPLLETCRALPEAERNAMLVLTPAQRFALENPDAPKPARAVPVRKTQRIPDSERLLAPAGIDKGRVYTNGTRWTTLEKAKLVRMVEYFQSHGVKSALSRLVIEAQELVMPADRRHNIKGIQASVSTGGLEKLMAEGRNNLWLLDGIPFDPPKPPRSEEPATETAPAGQETAQNDANAAQPVQTQPEPTPAPLPAASMSEAAQAFGHTMMQALDTLLGHHTQLVLASIETRLAEASARMAAEAASMIQLGMRKAVADMLAHELGGPVAPPAVTAPAPAAPAAADGKTPPPAPNHHHNPVPPSADRAEQLKVDVVGFEIGAQETLVQKSFGPGEVDLRFIHPDKMSSFAPHRGRHVVMMIGRVPHALSEKFRASKVTPIIVRRTPGHVIHAIEELQRARSANVQH